MYLMGEPRDNHPGPFLSAHRGAWGTDPGLSKPAVENSLAAIDNAADLKFEMVELDIKLTSDKKLVLMHDYTMGRTTNWADDMDIDDATWNPFKAETPIGFKPHEHGAWTELNKYNPLVSAYNLSTISGATLRLFDKTTGLLGTMNGANAKGSWVPLPSGQIEQVSTLQEALVHIGNNYPGMTVVLDLRHADEVKEAIKVIDLVTNCQGVPASEWVILKPFANVFPGGFFNAYGETWETTPHVNSVFCSFKRWFGSNSPTNPYRQVCNITNSADNTLRQSTDYRWIPVVSNRLVPPAPQGEPSVIPNAPGPDTSQIMDDVVRYLMDWNLSIPNGSRYSVVTAEVGYINPTVNPNITAAYNWVVSRVTNMQSWRPPDIDVVTPVVDPSNGKTIIGFNWKDDGLGAYPIYQGGSRTYEEARENAGIITVDDPISVLAKEAATRELVQMSISKPVTDRIVDGVVYKLVNKQLNQLLSTTEGLTQNTAAVTQYNDGETSLQEWKAMLQSDGSYKLVNQATGMSLSEVEPYALVGIVYNSDNLLQKWDITPNGDGTYRVINKKNGRALTSQTTFFKTVGYWGDNTQKWTLIPAPVPMYLEPVPTGGKALAVNGGSTSENTNVLIWQNVGPFHQQWKLVPIQDSDPHKFNLYKIVDRNSSKVLGTIGKGTTDGTAVTIQTYTNEAHQKWRLLNNAHGSFKLVNEKSNKVLTLPNTTSGTVAEIRTFNNGVGQRWGMSFVTN